MRFAKCLSNVVSDMIDFGARKDDVFIAPKDEKKSHIVKGFRERVHPRCVGCLFNSGENVFLVTGRILEKCQSCREVKQDDEVTTVTNCQQRFASRQQSLTQTNS